MEAATGAREGGSRARIAIAIAVGLTAAVVAVALTSGDEADQSAAAPERCVEAWNRDEAALAYGRHNFNFHFYEGALVTFLDRAGRELAAGEGGRCAVIFPSRSLDPEPFAAGQVLEGGGWTPISEMRGVDLARLAELQVLAAGSPNSALDAGGRLTAL